LDQCTQTASELFSTWSQDTWWFLLW